MSIKGSTSELYIGKEESNIITFFGKKIKIEHNELHKIDYCYHKIGYGGGYLEFTLKTGKNIRFDFNYKVNDKIENAIIFYKEHCSNVEITEHFVQDYKFYQKDWFIMTMLIFCCFPLGLFLLWYYKKHTTSVRIAITVIFLTIWGTGIYNTYQNYIITLNEVSSLMNSVNSNMYNTTSSIGLDETELEEIPYNTYYTNGTYKTGDTIPDGEYVVFNSSSDESTLGYIEISKDSSGSFDSIVANENFSYNTIITISSGQYLKIVDSYAVPITEVDVLDTTKNSGMFKIGKHLDAGEYFIQKSDSDASYGYVEVSKDSSHKFDSIVANENFESFTYITVEKGQYLKLSGCHISNEE